MRSEFTDPEQQSTNASAADKQQAAAARPENPSGGNSLYNEFGLPLPKWRPAAAHNASEPTAPEPAAPATAEAFTPAPAQREPAAAAAVSEEPTRSELPAAPPSRMAQFSGADASAQTEAESGSWGKSPHAAATHGEVDALKQRLARAEREVRVALGLLKGAVCLGIAGVVGAVAFSASRSYATLHDGSTVRVPFQVVDSSGQVLLRIDADQSNRRFRLFDSTGEAAVELGSTPDGGVLSVTGPGAGSALLLANADGGQLTVTGKKSTPIAWLGSRQNSGTLAFWDETGRQFACVSPKQQIGALHVLHQLTPAAPIAAQTALPAPRPNKARSDDKHPSRASPKSATAHKVLHTTAHPTASGHHRKPDHAQSRAVKAAGRPNHLTAAKPAGKPIRAAAVKPTRNPKPAIAVIGTAARGQKPTPSPNVVKLASLPKHAALVGAKLHKEHKGVKPPAMKAAGKYSHGKPGPVKLVRKPVAHPSVRVAAKPTTARKLKPALHTHRTPLPAGGRTRHHWRQNWRRHRGHRFWRSSGYFPGEWSHHGGRRLHHLQRRRSRRHERRWRRR
jgi:hypothetical protein